MKQKRLLALLLTVLLLVVLPQGAMAYDSPVVGKAYDATVYSAADAECLSAVASGTVPPGITISVSGTGLGNKVRMSGTPTKEGTYAFSIVTSLAGGNSRTDDVSLTVLPCASEIGVTIAVSPSASVALGSSITFAATVTGANGTLSYKWIRADGGGTGQLVGSSDRLTYMPASAVANASMHLEVTNTLNGTSTVKTTSATFTVTGGTSPTTAPTVTPTVTPTATPTASASNTPQISESPITGDTDGRIYNCRESVNVRSGPGTGYAVIGSAKLGRTFEALAKSGQWYKIQYTSSQIGYVHSNYFTLAALPNTTTAPTLSPSPSPAATLMPEPTLSASPSPTATLEIQGGIVPTATAAPTAIPAVNPGGGAGSNMVLFIMIGALGTLVVIAFVVLIVLLVKQVRLRREDDGYDSDDEETDASEEYDSDAEDEDDEEDLPDLGFRK